MEKTWSQTEIRALLETNNNFLKRALVKMYNRQTESEQEHIYTHQRNSVGFNKPDGSKLGSLAKFYVDRKFLTEKQIILVRRRLVRYTRQITDIANSIYKA